MSGTDQRNVGSVISGLGEVVGGCGNRIADGAGNLEMLGQGMCPLRFDP